MPSFAERADQVSIDELRAGGSVKWSRGGPGAIGAFIAEMDFGAAPPITEALIAAAPEFGLVIVYPLSALDEMISRYHAAHREDEGPQ